MFLAVATWRRATRPAIRAGLAIIAAAALTYALSDTVIASLLLLLDVVLVVGTWYLARTGRMASRLGIVWIVILILALLAAKLPQTQGAIGPGIWIGVSYLIFPLIHVALDARRNRLVEVTLYETVVYAVHPASLI